MNILILRVSAIGDVIHTLPAIFLLKRLYPNAKISWLVQRKAASLLQGQPFLENVWVLPDKFLKLKNWNETWQTLKQVRSVNWDAILDFQGLAKTSVLSACLKGETYGFDAKNSRTRFSAILNNHKISPQYTNIMQKNLALASNIQLREKAKTLGMLNPEFEKCSPSVEEIKKNFLWNVSTEKKKVVEEWLEENDIKNFVALSPNTTWESKHWPINHWKNVISSFSHHFPNHKVVLLGKSFGKSADLLYEYINEKSIDAFTAPEWDLITTSYLIIKSNLLVAPDTGILHMADFLGIKAIGIFGPTHAKKHGPFLCSENIENCIQIDCPHHYRKYHTGNDCMQKLKPEILFKNVKKALQA